MYKTKVGKNKYNIGSADYTIPNTTLKMAASVVIKNYFLLFSFSIRFVIREMRFSQNQIETKITSPFTFPKGGW